MASMILGSWFSMLTCIYMYMFMIWVIQHNTKHIHYMFSKLVSEHHCPEGPQSVFSLIMASATNSNTKNDLPSTVPVKLDKDNYPLWWSLALPITRGCKLDGYMLGTKFCPDEFITNTYTNAVTRKTLNLAYEDWQQWDQQLLGWLKNSMTQDLETQLLNYENSKEIWEETQSLAGAHTRSRVIYLNSEFHSLRKGKRKMQDYVIKMKKLSEELKLVGNPISNSNIII